MSPQGFMEPTARRRKEVQTRMNAHRPPPRSSAPRPEDANVEFSQYSEVLRRRWVLIVVGVFLGAGLAVAAIFVVPKTYESTASVLVAASGGPTGSVENGRTTAALNLDTEAQIVTSTSVASLVADDLVGSASPRDLAKRTSVSVPANTSVLDIAFTGPTPEEARDGAEAFAGAYLKNREELAQERIDVQQKSVQERVDVLNDQLEKVGILIQAEPVGSAAREFQSSRRDLIVRQIASVNEQLVSIEVAGSDPGDILTEPQLATQPIAPNVSILVAGGVMGGLLLGLVLAFVADRRDRRIRDGRDLERLGLNPLVPFVLVPPAGNIAPARNTPYDAEPMRMLRNSLLAQLPGHRGSVMVAAASAGSEGSSVALNLAAVLARSGLKVVFASADSEIVGDGETSLSSASLADLIHERVGIDELLQRVESEPDLWTLSPGKDGSLYYDLVESELLRPILDAFLAKVDILVFDVAPVAQNADAQTLASHFDGVLLVAAAKRTTLDDVAEAVGQLDHVSARVFGAVLAQQGSIPDTRRGSVSSA